jgi:hypothetical protein
MVVQVVAYSPHEVVEISRGENAGRVAEYTTSCAIGWSWANGTAPRPSCARVERAADLLQVVIVQGAGHGPILGTARVE